MFGQRNKNEKHQTTFLCEVTADFGVDAIGLGERDLNYGLDYFLHEIMEKYDRCRTPTPTCGSAGTDELVALRSTSWSSAAACASAS